MIALDVPALLEGFALGAGLIVAIGAQNALVLREGLMRRHTFTVATIGALSDGLLIAAGVSGVGALVAQTATLRAVATWGGALFLVVYGCLAARRALNPGALEAEQAKGPISRRAIVATMLAVTFLNPHVYLDTVVLLGSIAGRYPPDGRLAFGIGAVAASFVWFYGLAYGARLLAPLFARPAAWRVLDILIALVMWAIAASLVWDASART